MTENAITRINVTIRKSCDPIRVCPGKSDSAPSSMTATIPESAPAWHHAIAEDVITAWDAMDRTLIMLRQYLDDGDEQAALFKRAFGRVTDKVIGLAVDELWAAE
jgi:hypothetical protein